MACFFLVLGAVGAWTYFAQNLDRIIAQKIENELGLKVDIDNFELGLLNCTLDINSTEHQLSVKELTLSPLNLLRSPIRWEAKSIDLKKKRFII